MPRAYVALGVAPQNARHYNGEIEEAILGAFDAKIVKAIGSCGLSNKPNSIEATAFARQIELAKDLGAVLVVEAQGAYDQALAILEDCGFPHRSTILRSFDGSADQLDAWVDHGCYISFGATAENDPMSACELARRVPTDHLLVESDAPSSTLIALGNSLPRCDQVVFVADVLQGICPSPQLVANFFAVFE